MTDPAATARATGDATTPIRLHKALAAIWDTSPGWWRLAAVNHNILGKRFMVVALIFFAIGGVLAMLIRAQLATPDAAFIGPDLYSQLFTLHGTVMMFLFAIPMFEGFAIYMLPKLLGARDLAFPRITAYGFWCYVFGGSMIIAAMLVGYAPDSGWFMYTPLSSDVYSPGINSDVWLLGITFVEISAISAAIEIVVTILKMRAPGMSLDRMPIFAWYMLVTAGMMVLAFPPLILGSILLELERAMGMPFFDPERGGDPLLWQHLFWLFGHPEVYIIFLPAAGVLSTIIPVFAQRPLDGYRAVVVAIVAMAFLSFGLWVHHMFTVGIPHLALAFFSAASALVAIPTAVQIFAWLATLAHGRPRFDVPMLYVAGFFVVFVAGGLTGVMLAMVPFNTQAHDTHFVVAHLHYVLVGGFVFPMLAAIYYWLPHITGRDSNYRLAAPGFWLVFFGFNLTFFLMHLTGLRGMPRRISTYPAGFGWDWLNLLSSFGSFILFIGLALVLADIVVQCRYGRRRARDPWRAATLEWATATPPQSYNFASLPEVTERADRLAPRAIGAGLAAGCGYLGFAREGRQESLGVDITTGRVDQVIVLPRQSFLPFWTGLATAGVFLSMLFRLYWLTPLAALVLLAVLLAWPRTIGSGVDRGPLDIGRGASVPEDAEVESNVTTWASVITIVADATLYASLLFGALFLVVVAPGFAAAEAWSLAWSAALVPPTVAVVAAWCARRARALNAGGGAPDAWMLAAGGAAGLTGLSLLPIILQVPDATAHANAAVSFTILAYCIFHTALAMIVSFYGWWRRRQGLVSARRATALRIGVIWQDYTALATVLGTAMVLFLAHRSMAS